MLALRNKVGREGTQCGKDKNLPTPENIPWNQFMPWFFREKDGF